MNGTTEVGSVSRSRRERFDVEPRVHDPKVHPLMEAPFFASDFRRRRRDSQCRSFQLVQRGDSDPECEQAHFSSRFQLQEVANKFNRLRGEGFVSCSFCAAT
jgi:hypothetical protein